MIIYKENEVPSIKDAIQLYKGVEWGHIECPKTLEEALSNSDLIVTAWNDNLLVGLGRAISDSTLTVYYPDLLVHPNWQGKKIGTEIMKMLTKKYEYFHNQVLIAEDDNAKAFYKKFGFEEDNSALSITKPFPTE